MKNKSPALLIGLGKIGATYAKDHSMAKTVPFVTHAQVLSNHPEFRWHSAIDTCTHALDYVRKEYGIKNCFTDISSVPDLDKIELLVIATPPSSRINFLDLLPNLKAVLVEKPLGVSLSESLKFKT